MEQPFTIEAQFHALNHEQSSPVYQQHPKQTQHYNPLQCFATNTPTQKCPAATCVIANDAGQPSNPHKSNSTLLVSPSPVLRIAEVTLSTKLSPPRCWGKANQSVTCKPKTERFKPPVKLANPKWLKQWKKMFCETCLLQLLHPCQSWIRCKLGIVLLSFQHFLPEMLLILLLEILC